MIDHRTLIIGELLIPLAFIIIQLIEFGWTNKQAVKVNIGANAFQFLGYLFLLLCNLLPCFITFGLSSIFILASVIFMLITTFKVFKIRVPILGFKILGALIILSLLLFYLTDMLIIRFFIMSVGLGLICFYGVFYLLINIKNRKNKLVYVVSIEFVLIGIISIFRFILFRESGGFLKNSWESFIYIIQSSLFILIWNYTIQLKRNSIVMEDIKKSSKLLYKTQEDLSILNHIFYEQNVSNGLDNLYVEIFDLLKLRFNIQKAIIFINTDQNISAEHSSGFSSAEIEFLRKVIIPNTGIELTMDFVGDLPDGEYKNLLLSKGLLGGITYPLITRGTSVGSLFIGIVPSSTIVNSDREIVLSICQQIAGIIHNAQMYNRVLESQVQLKDMASTDSLTGLYNRREFFIQFRGEFSSTLRHKDNITLFILDLDNFNKVNDEFGHDAGDGTLIAVARFIRNQLRTNDLFARYGGEEFVGVLLRGDNEGTIKKLENLVVDISKLSIPNYPDIKVTISMGCCHYSLKHQDVESMIKRAEIALYKAKKSGKNCLCID